LIVFKANRQCG